MWKCRHCRSTHGQETQVQLHSILTHPNWRPPRTSTVQSQQPIIPLCLQKVPVSASPYPSCVPPQNCLLSNFINLYSVLFPSAISGPCLLASFPPRTTPLPRGSMCQRMLALKLKGAQKEGRKEGRKDVHVIMPPSLRMLIEEISIASHIRNLSK